MGRVVIPHGNLHIISPSTHKQDHNLKSIQGQVTSVQRDNDVKVSEKWNYIKWESKEVLIAHGEKSQFQQWLGMWFLYVLTWQVKACTVFIFRHVLTHKKKPKLTMIAILNIFYLNIWRENLLHECLLMFSVNHTQTCGNILIVT